MRLSRPGVALVTATALALSSVGSAAGARPEDGCASPMVLTTWEQVLALTEGGPNPPEEMASILAQYDRNGDRLFCRPPARFDNASPWPAGVILFNDNSVPAGGSSMGAHSSSRTVARVGGGERGVAGR